MTCEPVAGPAALAGPGSLADPGSLAGAGPLAYTGSGVQLGLLLTVGIICLVGGGLLLLLSRRRGRAVTVALFVLLCGAGMSITTGTPAHADDASDCPPAQTSPAVGQNSLTVTQTSTMEGLAPGIAPVPITGIVSNIGTDSTDIVAVDVQITGVTAAAGAAPGVCEPSDYFIVNSLMPVGRTLDPGGSTTFAGASIGFNNKSTNQDTCKGATIQLLYTANPA